MFKLKINGLIKEFNSPIKLIDLAPKNAICVKVNNRLRELNYEINFDADIEFLFLDNYESMRIYEAGLRYLISMVISKIDKNAIVTYDYSVSKAIFCKIDSNIIQINNQFLNDLYNELKLISKKNYSINRLTLTRTNAEEIFLKDNKLDKLNMLEYRKNEKVHLYECNGYKNYMYSYMVPNTSLINDFKFLLYANGFIIQYPRSENKGIIPEFKDDFNFSRALEDERKWINILECKNIYKMNYYIKNNNISDYVNMCETRHSNMLAELGNIIKQDLEHIRLICVAGPSSSGKTTFTNRLRIELMTKGIKPLMISLDDYYLNASEAPKDEDGNPDLEHINALDINLFNEHMFKLINGEEVNLPTYNFMLKKREFKRTVKIDKNTPILIEGIHALNDLLTTSIPKHQKYKIYISPQPQYHIDSENPISITDIRLIRRIVRDMQFRNTPIEKTFDMWPSVRRGEFKWIYPNQDNADYVFNSELCYELSVLKKYAIKPLENIKEDSQYYIEANRLLKFLKYFIDIPDKYVPANSLLREFIGGSSYYI